MRILKEDVEPKIEELPISFITDTISKSWEEVGYLKDASAAIRTDYANTEKVEQLMQDLMDAYLVFIGQLEAYLHKEDYIDEPVATESTVEEKTENVSEISKPTKEDNPLPAAALEIEPIVDDKTDVKPTDATVFNSGDFDDYAISDKELEAAREPVNKDDDAFDFFVDFDEPDMSEPRITDDELYGHEDSEFEHNRLRSML